MMSAAQLDAAVHESRPSASASGSSSGGDGGPWFQQQDYSTVDGAYVEPSAAERAAAAMMVDDEAEFGPARPPAAAAAATSSVYTAAADSSAAAATPAPAPAVTPLRRVRIYRLGQGGTWEDKGTGYLSYIHIRDCNQRTLLDDHGNVVTDPSESNFCLVIIAEIDTKAAAAAAAGSASPLAPPARPVILMEHPVCSGMEYGIQGQTIITWSLAASGAEIALSFQEADVCADAWRMLSQQLEFIQPQPAYLRKVPLDPGLLVTAEAPSVGMEFGLGLMQDRSHDLDVGLDIHGGGGMHGAEGGEEDFGLTHVMMEQHDAMNPQHRQQQHGRLPDDYDHTDPVNIEALAQLTSRLPDLRICRRELEEVIHIFQAKEAEFFEVLAEEKLSHAQQRGQAALNVAATAPASPNASPTATTPADLPASPLQVTTSAATEPAEFSPLQHCLGQLQSIFRFVKSLLLTNDVEVLEILFSDTRMDSLVAMLEYDPANETTPCHMPGGYNYTTHRTFLKHAHFKYVIPFYDEVVLHKIHQSYKVTYLKDVILANHLDDATLGTFTQILFVNMVSIISRLTEKKEFIDALFGTLNQFAQIDGLEEQKLKAEAEREQRMLLERQTTVLLQGAEGGSDMQVDSSSQLNASLDSLQSDSTQQDTPSPQAKSASSASSPPSSSLSTAAAGASPPPADPVRDTSPVPVQASLDTTAPLPAASSTPPAPVASLRTVLLFLQELVLMAKNVQVPVRDAFYKVLDQNALFEVIEAILVQDEERQRKERGRAFSEDVDDAPATGAAPAAAASSALPTPPSLPTVAFSTSAPAPAPIGCLDSSGDPHSWLWLICTDIISNICIHDASLFRTYLIATFNCSQSILKMIFRLLSMRNLSISLAHQMSCLIRLVLDPEAMSLQDQHLFLGRIYADHLHKLLRPLKHLQPTKPDENPFSRHHFSESSNPLVLLQESKQRQQRDTLAASYHIAAYHAIELLSYCALHHNTAQFENPIELSSQRSSSAPPSDNFRTFAAQHNVLPFVLNILRTTRRNDLVCSAIRFFRICIGSKDDFYTKQILEHNLFECIFMHFQHNGNRYNLLNSVVCEMVHFFNETHHARKKDAPLSNVYNPNSIVFLRHMHANDYGTRFGLNSIQYVDTFQISRQILLEDDEERARKAKAAQFWDEPEMFGDGGRAGARTSISRTMHSILSDSDDEDEVKPASALANNYIKAAPSQSSGRAKERNGSGGKHREKVTKRRRTPKRSSSGSQGSTGSGGASAAAAAAADPQAEQKEQEGLQLNPLYYIDEVSEEVHENGDSSFDSVEDEVEQNLSDEEQSPEQPRRGRPSIFDDGPMSDEEADDATPARRIVFVSEQDGAVQRQPLPQSERRNSKGKRKHEEDVAAGSNVSPDSKERGTTFSAVSLSPMPLHAAASLAPAMSPPPAVPSPLHSPPLHGSPTRHTHNPFLHVPQSELPPTALRSPELRSLSAADLVPTASAAPSSPPRAVTALDLAEDADAADEIRQGGVQLSPQRSASASTSASISSALHHSQLSPHSPSTLQKARSAPSTVIASLQQAQQQHELQAAKRRRLEGST